MMKTIYFAFLFFASLSHAGEEWYEKGNGGFAQQCGDTYYSFDVVEAEARRKMVLETESTATTQERVEHLIGKIAKHNPARAALYREWYRTFESEAEFIPNMRLTPINDAGLAYKGPFRGVHCEKDAEQVIYQREPSILNDKRYTVSKDLWDRLDPFNQASLVLHELIYRELALPPSAQKTSESTRYLNGWIQSTGFAQASLQDYLTVLRKLYVVRAEYAGLPILIAGRDDITGIWYQFPLEFHENGQVQQAVLDSTINTQRSMNIGSTMITVEGCSNEGPLKTMGLATFALDGQINRLSFLGDDNLPLQQCEGAVRKQNYILIANDWSFDSTGKLEQAALHMKNSQSAMLIFGLENSLGITLFPSNNAVSVRYQMDEQEKIVSIKSIGSNCYDRSRHGIRIWGSEFGLLDEETTWTPATLEQDLKNLPVCKK